MGLVLQQIFLNPWFSTLLLMICFTAIVVEIFTPTYGVATAVAVATFILYFISGYMQRTAGLIELIAFIASAVLGIVEVTLSGFGPAGIGSIALLCYAVVASGISPGVGIATLLSSLAVSIAVGALLVKAGYQSRILNKSVLSNALSSEKGYLAKKNRSDLLHKEGVSCTVLRPVGEVKIGEERIEALTEGEFIEKGALVVVHRVTNGQVFVRRKRDV